MISVPVAVWWPNALQFVLVIVVNKMHNISYILINSNLMKKDLKSFYKQTIVPSLINDFGYKNIEQVPKITAISISHYVEKPVEQKWSILVVNGLIFFIKLLGKNRST